MLVLCGVTETANVNWRTLYETSWSVSEQKPLNRARALNLCKHEIGLGTPVMIRSWKKNNWNGCGMKPNLKKNDHVFLLLGLNFGAKHLLPVSRIQENSISDSYWSVTAWGLLIFCGWNRQRINNNFEEESLAALMFHAPLQLSY